MSLCPPPSLTYLRELIQSLNACRATESLVRSINNLLERLHASGFLYLMTSVETFISASNYLAAPILIGAGLTIDGLLTWAQAGRDLKGQAREKPVLLAMVLLGVVFAVGAAQMAIVARVDPTRELPVGSSFFAT